MLCLRKALKPVNDPNSWMVTDRTLLDVVQTGDRGFLEQDAIHLRVEVVLLQVSEVDLPGLERYELVVELDVLEVLVEEQAVADANLA